MIRTQKLISRALVIILALLLTAGLVLGTSPLRADAAVNEDVKEPTIKSKAAILYCVNTDEILFSKNADKIMNPYSITKLMTALVAMDNLDMDTKVVVDSKAASIGESTMYLTEGEEVTVEQLLYGLLINSGNDAAYLLSEASAGSEAEFVARMNAKAKELGCTDTTFKNPHGLKAKGHVTTAEDFLKIAKAAFANETIREISGTKKYHMAATNKSDDWYMETHLDLLEDEDSGVVAGKTGYWDEDDCSVSLLYDKDGLEMILILMGSEIKSRPKDAEKILKFGTEKIVTLDAVVPDTKVTTVLVKHGAETRVPVMTDKTIHAYPKNGKKSSIDVSYEFKKGLEAPLAAGTEVGVAHYTVDGKPAGDAPLYLMEDVKTGWLPSYLYISNLQTVLLGSVAGLLVILLVMRKKRKVSKVRVKNRKDKYVSKH